MFLLFQEAGFFVSFATASGWRTATSSIIISPATFQQIHFPFLLHAVELRLPQPLLQPDKTQIETKPKNQSKTQLAREVAQTNNLLPQPKIKYFSINSQAQIFHLQKRPPAAQPATTSMENLLAHPQLATSNIKNSAQP
jgi:hypothetical protein